MDGEQDLQRILEAKGEDDSRGGASGMSSIWPSFAHLDLAGDASTMAGVQQEDGSGAKPEADASNQMESEQVID